MFIPKKYKIPEHMKMFAHWLGILSDPDRAGRFDFEMCRWPGAGLGVI